MPSKDELRKQIEKARKSRSAGSKAIKQLADVQVPKQARKARVNLIQHIRSLVKKMSKRITVLKKRLEKKRAGGAKKAVEWAKDQVGRTESPPSSNAGPYPVSACQEFTIGYDGVPWCGCFVAYAAIEKGGATIPLKARLAYTPYICADGSSNTNGLHGIPVSSAQPGDFIVFNFGSGGAKHVGLCVSPTTSVTKCVEGNTSSSSGGSQDNGGAVAYRERPTSHAICAVRPDYS